MTDQQPTQPAPQDFAEWDRKEREFAARAEELLPANKKTLFDALAAAGITSVVVTFDGCGDSGQIEHIEARTGEEAVPLPSGQIEIACAVWHSREIKRQNLSIGEAIETLAYNFLGQTHGGWENNDGAYGEFTFDVAEQTISLEYNERHMESVYFEHMF